MSGAIPWAGPWTGAERAALRKAWAAALPERTGDEFVRAVCAIIGSRRGVKAVREYGRRLGLRVKTPRNVAWVEVRCKRCGDRLTVGRAPPSRDALGRWWAVHVEGEYTCKP